jgi:peptidyl-prolyl cis-trans isomerase SurA
MIEIERFNYMKQVLVVFFILSSFNIHSQIQNSDSLVFSIDDDPVFTSEILRQYKKNSSSNLQNETINLDEYVELYLRYKLKVQAAKDMGLDTLSSFQEEYERYRRQLADKYISNGKVTQDMVEDIYHRMKTEVNASHILLSLKPEATPADTLETYNTAIDLLKKIKKGESFEELAMKYSKDPSVRQNKGNLGWFKAYKMVYPFENAAYNLEKNEVSQPVRTKFGYHLIKKNDERPSKGKIKVAHIMKRLLPNDSTQSVEKEIYKIYDKLKTGEDFSDIAKQFSDHQATAAQGGELSPFGIGDMNSTTFEEIAFNIDEVNSISEPFKTKFGWHIIKYNGNIPVQPLAEIESEIIKKIKTSDRSKRLISNIKKDLMQQYEVNINYEILSSLEDRIDDSIIKYKWIYNETESDKSEWVLQIDEHYYSLNEFLEYIQKQQRSLSDETISGKLNEAIDKFAYAKLIKVHNENLENVSPEFASEIKTYFEGLLLFEVMEKKIWKPVQNDSVSLKKYYDLNRDKFISPTSLDGFIVSGSDKATIKEIKEAIGQDSLASVKKQFPNSIFRTLEKTDKKSSFLPYELMLELENPKIYKHNGQFICVYITKVYPSMVMEFSNIKGKVIDQLQKDKEEEWIAELKSEYNINVNYDLIQKINQSLEK